MKITLIALAVIAGGIIIIDYALSKYLDRLNKRISREKWRYDLLAVAHLEPEAEEAVEEMLHELGIKVMEDQ